MIITKYEYLNNSNLSTEFRILNRFVALFLVGSEHAVVTDVEIDSGVFSDVIKSGDKTECEHTYRRDEVH